MKTGKIHGAADVHLLDSRVGAGDSDLHVTFCTVCGGIVGIRVADPNKIK